MATQAKGKKWRTNEIRLWYEYFMGKITGNFLPLLRCSVKWKLLMRLFSLAFSCWDHQEIIIILRFLFVSTPKLSSIFFIRRLCSLSLMSTELNISLFASCLKMYKVMWFLSGNKYVYELEWFSAWNTKSSEKYQKLSYLLMLFVYVFLFRHFAEQETNKKKRMKDVWQWELKQGVQFRINERSKLLHTEISFYLDLFFFVVWFCFNFIALHFEIPNTKHSTYIFLQKHARTTPQIYANVSNQKKGVRKRENEEKPKKPN